MKLFAQIRKVDEAKRLVYARAVQETVDKVDEIFDYASSKPLFEAWSKEQFDASGGKSYGNVRAMHGKIAAGIVAEPLAFNDDELAIDTAIKVTDDQEWSKCLDGTYTGVSIGGSYVGERKTEKVDGREVKRYTARPAEISLVDSPCIPTARFFEIVKADGSIAKVDFKVATSEGPTPIEVTGTDEQVAAFAKLLNDSSLTLTDAIAAITGANEARAVEKAVADQLDTIEAMEKREFSSDERKQAAKEGAALPDGSFPIKTVADLENAVRALGRAKDKAAAKAHIIKRAKALGATDKLPKGWTDAGKADTGGEVKKGLWNVSRFAEVLESLAMVCASAQYDLDTEGDDSPVPQMLRNAFDELATAFKAMSAEEAEEALADLKTRAGVGEDDEIESAVELAAKVGELKKRLTDPALTVADAEKLGTEYGEPLGKDFAARVLAKAGARHSAADKKRLQDAHDSLVAMGADCAGEKAAPTGDLTKVADVQAKLDAALQRIAKLEAQPLPFVTLRTVAVPREKDGPQPPAEKTVPDDLSDVVLDPADYIRNGDGSIDYYASRLLKAHKLANTQPATS